MANLTSLVRLSAAKKSFAEGALEKSKQMLEKAGGTKDGWEAYAGFYAKVIKTGKYA